MQFVQQIPHMLDEHKHYHTLDICNTRNNAFVCTDNDVLLAVCCCEQLIFDISAGRQ